MSTQKMRCTIEGMNGRFFKMKRLELCLLPKKYLSS